jgi:hypothetical protein
VNVFERDWSAQSRTFKYFINHIYQKFKQWWCRYAFFAASTEAIERKFGVEDRKICLTTTSIVTSRKLAELLPTSSTSKDYH